jgi:hypothetical protein
MQINVGFQQASKIIDALAQNNWRPLAPARLAELTAREPGGDLY